MKEIMDIYMRPLEKKIFELKWSDESSYKQYLAQSYYYIFHSCKLLALAAANCSEEQSAYYNRCIKHIAEEAGHDNIAVKDLERLGGHIVSFEELEMTRALWEPQYYKTQKAPTSLLGYILALEYLAVRTFPKLFDLVKSNYGEEKSRFIKVHAEDDPDHLDQAITQIEKLSAKEQNEVIKNYAQTCIVFGHFLDACFSKEETRSENLQWQNQQAPLGA